MTSNSCEQNDWCRNPTSCVIAWGIPIAGLILSSSLARDWMPIVWPVSLAWMGTACFLNVRRCGRLHCYTTGPFFFVMAIASALHGFGVIDLGPTGWSWISTITIVGGIALTWGPELVFGRYRSST
jgi:hypothetical protein